MSSEKRTVKRPYDAPQRRAAAKQTRRRILTAAKAEFEAKGWSGATMAAIARQAGVSRKTVELAFGTKADLLGAAFYFSIGGGGHPAATFERPMDIEMDDAPDAEAMLERHARLVVAAASRSARIATVIESAGQAGGPLAELSERLEAGRRQHGSWAAKKLLEKPGVRPDLSLEGAEQLFLLAVDWGNYRRITRDLDLDDEGVREWLLWFYRHCFLPQPR